MLHVDACHRQESYFHYLFGVQEEDYLGAIDLRTGRSILFMPRLPPSYAVWSGHIAVRSWTVMETPSAVLATMSVQACLPSRICGSLVGISLQVLDFVKLGHRACYRLHAAFCAQ